MEAAAELFAARMREVRILEEYKLTPNNEQLIGHDRFIVEFKPRSPLAAPCRLSRPGAIRARRRRPDGRRFGRPGQAWGSTTDGHARGLSAW